MAAHPALAGVAIGVGVIVAVVLFIAFFEQIGQFIVGLFGMALVIGLMGSLAVLGCAGLYIIHTAFTETNGANTGDAVVGTIIMFIGFGPLVGILYAVIARR